MAGGENNLYLIDGLIMFFLASVFFIVLTHAISEVAR